jgi:hypothetical protein
MMITELVVPCGQTNQLKIAIQRGPVAYWSRRILPTTLSDKSTRRVLVDDDGRPDLHRPGSVDADLLELRNELRDRV